MADKKKTPNKIVVRLAKSYNFDNAEFVMEYEDCDVFTPFNNDGSIPIIGQPIFILSTKKMTRIATENECFAIMKLLHD